MVITFPVQEGYGIPRTERIPNHIKSIAWALIVGHDKQAHRNHSQSLAVLASRGGCSPCEVLAIIEDRSWHKMDKWEAHKQLEGML